MEKSFLNDNSEINRKNDTKTTVNCKILLKGIRPIKDTIKVAAPTFIKDITPLPMALSARDLVAKKLPGTNIAPKKR